MFGSRPLGSQEQIVCELPPGWQVIDGSLGTDVESPCYIAGGPVQLLYWPVETVGGLCGKNGSTLSPTGPRTVTYEGTVLTSPTVYLSFSTIHAYTMAPEYWETNYTSAMGQALSNYLIAEDPKAVSTACLAGDVYADPNDGMEYPMNVTSLNYADLNKPIRSAPYFCAESSSMVSGTIWDKFAPLLVFPTDIIKVQPAWKSCSVPAGSALGYVGDFIFDPPRALTAGTLDTPTTAPALPVTTTPPAPAPVRTTSAAPITSIAPSTQPSTTSTQQEYTSPASKTHEVADPVQATETDSSKSIRPASPLSQSSDPQDPNDGASSNPHSESLGSDPSSDRQSTYIPGDPTLQASPSSIANTSPHGTTATLTSGTASPIIQSTQHPVASSPFVSPGSVDPTTADSVIRPNGAVSQSATTPNDAIDHHQSSAQNDLQTTSSSDTGAGAVAAAIASVLGLTKPTSTMNSYPPSLTTIPGNTDPAPGGDDEAQASTSSPVYISPATSRSTEALAVSTYAFSGPIEASTQLAGVVITLKSKTYTAIVSSDVVLFDSQTLTLGSSATVSGLSAVIMTSAIVIGSHTYAFSSLVADAVTQPAQAKPHQNESPNSVVEFTLDSHTLTAIQSTDSSGAGVVIIDGNTLTAGGTAFSMYGQVISTGSDELVVGSSTLLATDISATNDMAVLTIGSQVYTASRVGSGADVIGGTTLSQGAAVTVDGATLSAGSAAVVVDGSETVAFSQAAKTTSSASVAMLTIGSQIFTATMDGLGDAVIGGTTLTRGAAVTVDGETASVGSAGVVIHHSETVHFSAVAKTTSTGTVTTPTTSSTTAEGQVSSSLTSGAAVSSGQGQVTSAAKGGHDVSRWLAIAHAWASVVVLLALL